MKRELKNGGTMSQLIGKELRQKSTILAKGNIITRKLKSILTPEKDIILTPEQQARQREAEMRTYFENIPLQGLEAVKNGKGECWNVYSLSKKAVYGKITEDLRAEKPNIFYENYSDMLMNAMTAVLDTESVAKQVQRMTAKATKDGLNLTDKQILLRAYFRVATRGVDQWIDANKATFYRQAVNEQGKLPTKEERKEMRQARSDWYAERKYAATIESIDEETMTTVYEYHAPIEHYRQRVATVNQDARYKASSSWEDANAMVADAGELELQTVLLDMNLQQLLKDKPNDLEIARQLAAGILSADQWRKLKYQRRERIKGAFAECLNA